MKLARIAGQSLALAKQSATAARVVTVIASNYGVVYWSDVLGAVWRCKDMKCFMLLRDILIFKSKTES